MPGGRPKKSSAQKRFEGNRSKVKIVDEPVVSYKAPSCPRNVPPEVKKIWKQLAPQLIRARKLNQFNAHAFKEHCVIIMTLDDLDNAIYETCRSLLQENVTVDPTTGIETTQYKEAALSKVRRHYMTLLDRSNKAFGFTAVQFEGHYRYDEDESDGELI